MANYLLSQARDPWISFHQHHKDSWHIWCHLRKDIVSSCNSRCWLIFLYGHSRTYRVASLSAGLVGRILYNQCLECKKVVKVVQRRSLIFHQNDLKSDWTLTVHISEISAWTPTMTIHPHFKHITCTFDCNLCAFITFEIKNIIIIYLQIMLNRQGHHLRGLGGRRPPRKKKKRKKERKKEKREKKRKKRKKKEGNYE